MLVIAPLICLYQGKDRSGSMDPVDLPMGSLEFQSPVLGYARLGILAMASSFWTWAALVLTALLSLWRFRGAKGFSVRFTWWGKHAQVRVLLQSSSCSPSSSSSAHKTIRRNGNASVDDLNGSRNAYMDDLDLLAYRKQTLNDRGIYRRSRSKSSSTFDSLTLCNSIDSECLDVNRRNPTCFLETEMVFIFEKSTSSRFVPKSTSFCIKGNPFAGQQLQPPTYRKLDWSIGGIGGRIQSHEQLCTTVGLAKIECWSSEEFVEIQSGKLNSCNSLSSKFIFEEEGGDGCKGSGFVFQYDEREEEGFYNYFLDSYISQGGCQRLVSFESQYGWDKLFSFRLGFAWDCCSTERFGLNLDRYSEYFVRDNVAKVWDGPRQRLMNLLRIPEGLVSCLDISWNKGLLSVCTVDSSVQLWDLQMAKCLNETVIKNGISVGTNIQDSHESLLSGIVTRDEEASVFVWDPRVFVKPVSFLLGNQPSFHTAKINEKKIHVLDGFNDKLFDMRMPGASPIEVSPMQYKDLPSSLTREDTTRPLQNTYSEDFLFNEDDDVCENGSHGVPDSGKSCRSSLFERCIGAVCLMTLQSTK